VGHGQPVSRGSLQQVRGGGPVALLTAVRQEIRTGRPGGSVPVPAAARTGGLAWPQSGHPFAGPSRYRRSCV